jgi:hypothetical protein
MANAVYPKFKEQLLQGGVNMATADIRFILFDVTDDAYDAANEFVSDLVAGAIVKRTAAGVGSKTFTNGVFDAADVAFLAVTGDVCEAIIVYVYNAADGAARLIAWLDTGITGIPVTPNSGDINVTWDSGANKIFVL